jgi:hypothetical protein
MVGGDAARSPARGGRASPVPTGGSAVGRCAASVADGEDAARVGTRSDRRRAGARSGRWRAGAKSSGARGPVPAARGADQAMREGKGRWRAGSSDGRWRNGELRWALAQRGDRPAVRNSEVHGGRSCD